MISIDMSLVSPTDAYKLLSGCVVPRPIAWVGTTSSAGIHNLAPFSHFTIASSNPPTLLFCPTLKEDGNEKDTLTNIRESAEFTVNLVQRSHAQAMNLTAASLAPNESEFDFVKVVPQPSIKIKAPRVGGAPIQFECRLLDVINVSMKTGKPGPAHIVLGEVLYAHINEPLIDSQYHVDYRKADLVARLAGHEYTPLGNIFSLVRPR